MIIQYNVFLKIIKVFRLNLLNFLIPYEYIMIKLQSVFKNNYSISRSICHDLFINKLFDPLDVITLVILFAFGLYIQSKKSYMILVC